MVKDESFPFDYDFRLRLLFPVETGPCAEKLENTSSDPFFTFNRHHYCWKFAWNGTPIFSRALVSLKMGIGPQPLDMYIYDVIL